MLRKHFLEQWIVPRSVSDLKIAGKSTQMNQWQTMVVLGKLLG